MSLPITGPIDVVLQLLDHQIVDVDGRMVGNVDDIEVSEWPDGTLAVTGLLVGAAALVPRLSGGSGDVLRRRWHDLGVEQHDRDVPGYIDLALVADFSSQVDLAAPRVGVVRRQPQTGADGALLHRLTDLLGMVVRAADHELGHVLDARLEPEGGEPGHRTVFTALVVGRGRPGALLGYHRHPDQGPYVINRLVRWLHRHTRLVDLELVDRIDWVAGQVHLREAPRAFVPADKPTT